MLTILVRVKILTDALASVASVWIRACLSLNEVMSFWVVRYNGDEVTILKPYVLTRS
jgi:hypothetical protein